MWWSGCSSWGVVAIALAFAAGCDHKSQRRPQPAAPPPDPTSAGFEPSAPHEAREAAGPTRTTQAKGPDTPAAALDSAASRAPGKEKASERQGLHRRYVVAALGDSITDGRSGGGGYLRVLGQACPESRFIDFGKGGDMTNQMRRRLQTDILPQKEALGLTTLLIYGAVNDLYSDRTAGRTNDKIEADLSAIYAAAHEAGLEVIAITVSPWGGFKKYFNDRRGQNTQLLNSWILGQVGQGAVDKAVDSYALLSCGDPQTLCPEYETRFSDGLHLGPKGHEKLGEKLLREAFSDCR